MGSFPGDRTDRLYKRRPPIEHATAVVYSNPWGEISVGDTRLVDLLTLWFTIIVGAVALGQEAQSIIEYL